MIEIFKEGKINSYSIIGLVLLSILLVKSICAIADSPPVGHLLNVVSQFRDVKTPANLWIQIRNVDNGSVRPLMVRLNDKYESRVLSTTAVNYRIEQVWLQFDNGVIARPCQYDQGIISKKGVSVTFMGDLSPGNVRCKVRTYAAMPIGQLRPEKEVDIARESTPHSDEAIFFKELSQCIPGAHQLVYGDPFAKRVLPVFITINGVIDGLCSVTKQASYTDPVRGDTNLEVHCNFSPATQHLLTDDMISKLAGKPDIFEGRSKDAYQKAVCQECVAALNGEKVTC